MFVFTRSGSAWTLQTKLTGADGDGLGAGLALSYNEAFMGLQTPWHPFTAHSGDIWAPVAYLRFGHVSQLGAASEQPLGLPFYPQTGDVVVLHGQQALQKVRCLR